VARAARFLTPSAGSERRLAHPGGPAAVSEPAHMSRHGWLRRPLPLPPAARARELVHITTSGEHYRLVVRTLAASKQARVAVVCSRGATPSQSIMGARVAS
jgi:hypothetical protein